MTRANVVTDRVLVGLIGLAFMALGSLAVAWQLDYLPEDRRTLALAWAVDVDEQAWWAWALGAGGAVAIVLGLWWLVAHRPRRGLGEVTLPGTNGAGALRVDLDTFASAAASTLGTTPSIATARGRSLADRGQRIIEITATAADNAGLADVVSAATTQQANIVESATGIPVVTRIALHAKPPRRGRTER